MRAAFAVNVTNNQEGMSLTRAREFLLGLYHDLPNVLFVGSLILGSMTGYLPLVWVSLGLILNGGLIAAVQGLLALLFPNWAQVFVNSSPSCDILSSTLPGGDGTTVVAPSYWLGATVFFAVFSVYNSVRVHMKPPVNGSTAQKVDVRRAFSLSVLVIGVVFFLMVLLRGFSGCETWLGGILGVLFGGASAVGYWHLLDACGTGMIPDLLQVVGSLPPPGSGSAVPVVCTPPPPR